MRDRMHAESVTAPCRSPQPPVLIWHKSTRSAKLTTRNFEHFPSVATLTVHALLPTITAPPIVIFSASGACAVVISAKSAHLRRCSTRAAGGTLPSSIFIVCETCHVLDGGLPATLGIPASSRPASTLGSLHQSPIRSERRRAAFLLQNIANLTATYA